MATLSDYKNTYRKAKKQTTKSRIMNRAMLNLNTTDQQKFIRWQTERSKIV